MHIRLKHEMISLYAVIYDDNKRNSQKREEGQTKLQRAIIRRS